MFCQKKKIISHELTTFPHTIIGDKMKKVLITGARSGIASAVIQKLKQKDYFIYVTVHNNKQLEQVTKKYSEDKNIECLKLDITNPLDLKKIEPLNIDILINNAAIGKGGSLAEIPIPDLRENFEVNVISSFELIQLVLKKMIPKRDGKIIIMGSLAGIVPLCFLGSYSGTKASINKMADVLRREVKEFNIQVKLIEPGLYATGFNHVMFDNKYTWMYDKSYFKSELQLIRSKEHLLLHYLEKQDLTSIVNKIVKAVEDDSHKFIYRSPFLQVCGAKLYELFFQ